jgi:ABC-2 type transport system permease protein
MGVVLYAAHRLGLHPSAAELSLYALMLVCGLVIHYSILVLVSSFTFWTMGGQGLEGGYFTLFEFSRLPREAFKGVARILFVWLLPVVVVTTAPVRMLLHGFEMKFALWLVAVAAGWLALAVVVFNRGLRRYASASS